MMNRITKEQKEQMFRYVELLYSGALRNNGFCTYVGKKIGMPAKSLHRHKWKMLRQIRQRVAREKAEVESQTFSILGIPYKHLPAYIKFVKTLAE